MICIGLRFKMREYTDEQYVRLVENIIDEILQSMMEKEIEIIKGVKNSKQKTFIDLGAGCGRLTPILGEISKNFISIEINPNMLLELNKRSFKFKNSKVIFGSLENLFGILQKESVQNPVLLLVQNSLGTIEGDWKKVLEEIRKIFENCKGEIIISFFRTGSLEDWGIKLYYKVSEMTGEPDLEKTDFEKGLFVSKTGYVSKWRSDEEIEEIKKFFEGKILKEIWTKDYCILHMGFN